MDERITDKLLEWAQSIENMASAEIPIWASEIIAYTTWNAHIWFYIFLVPAILFSVLFIISSCYIMKHHKDCKNSFTWDSPQSDVVIIFFLIGVFCIVGSGWTYGQVKKCQVAPRLVLLEYIKK